MVFRALGCVIALPLLHPAADLLAQITPFPGAQAVDFHILFNCLLALVLFGLLDPAAALLVRLLPPVARPDDPGRPLYLDAEALETPYLALANAAREVLRMGDLVEAMLRRFLDGLTADDRGPSEALGRLGRELDRLQDAVKAYLSRIAADDMAETDARRLQEMQDFAVNLGHAGDIVERSLAELSRGRGKRRLSVDAADRSDLVAFHGRVIDDLRLALSTFMAEDLRGARQLLDAKRQLGELERSFTREHLARLTPAAPGALGASALHLAALRDLKRVNSHLSAIGYSVLAQGQGESEQAGEAEPVAD